MFRNPRENANPSTTTPVLPSTGRPPTPPNTLHPPQPKPHPQPQTKPPSTMAGSTKPLTPRPSSKSNVPSLNRSSVKKPFSTKTPAKPNASILNFFKKVDSPFKDESIFVSGSSGVPSRPKVGSPALSILDSEEDLYGDDDLEGEVDRYNESTGSVKKRKIGHGEKGSVDGDGYIDTEGGRVQKSSERVTRLMACSPPPLDTTTKVNLPTKPKKKKKKVGPFILDSDSEDNTDDEVVQRRAVSAEEFDLGLAVSKRSPEVDEVVQTEPVEQKDIKENTPVVPAVESVLLVDDAVWMPRKRVPVAEAQAKWKAMQPSAKAKRKAKREAEKKIEEKEEGVQPVTKPRKESKNEAKKQAEERGEDMQSKKDTKKVAKKNAEDKESSDSPNEEVSKHFQPPALKKESTSVDDWGKFDDIDEEFPIDDELADGEEFQERKWMEEQARLEALEQEEPFEGFDEEHFVQPADDDMTAACPICESSLAGITPDDASRHVNACLDGNPIPLPAPAKAESSEVKFLPPEAKNRFARKAAIARPGQANPFEIGSTNATPSSAFSKLMSGHAEDAAWASAAASEHSSRGKPAYQRTCPFYKIMPGFFICVDAFRYGAVQGCNAYFLSHFHSDHYIGLTSTWCHGPIYCSKVTANLVKQQLRVDLKYVVALDFESRFEVPGTQGVAITMIPANHCPGSSLFLFEKTIGKGANPKIQRVLHCGDFRACPAHLAHPLLMPDVVDSITGKTKHQKIDVCYLDTTYLNPRYSFPSQEEVVKACADMCVSLRKERAEEDDSWEKTKRQRAGTGMTKFVNSALKPTDDSIAMSLSKTDKPRGRLLVICGTYSIGKERICMGIARALDCKIWAPPGKMKICKALEDPELMSRMTDDPREAQIHMQMLMEIRAETLQDYLNGFKPHFSRIVGFRPSGWNYRPPNSRFTESPSTDTILRSSNWKSSFSMAELVPQRGSTREASCFGVPYSEHSSFRELTMFVTALRIEKVVPTVNVGTAAGRAKMKTWIERWFAERRKNGVTRIGTGEGDVRW